MRAETLVKEGGGFTKFINTYEGDTFKKKITFKGWIT